MTRKVKTWRHLYLLEPTGTEFSGLHIFKSVLYHGIYSKHKKEQHAYTQTSFLMDLESKPLSTPHFSQILCFSYNMVAQLSLKLKIFVVQSWTYFVHELLKESFQMQGHSFCWSFQGSRGKCLNISVHPGSASRERAHMKLNKTSTGFGRKSLLVVKTDHTENSK